MDLIFLNLCYISYHPLSCTVFVFKKQEEILILLYAICGTKYILFFLGYMIWDLFLESLVQSVFQVFCSVLSCFHLMVMSVVTMHNFL
jgi:hypothetical protein